MANLTIFVPEGTISWQLLRENFTSSSSTAIAGKLSTFIKYWRIANVVLYVVIFVTSAVGNGLVCFIIIRKRSMKSVVNYLILNLAMADLIFTCVCIPLDIPVQQMNYVWPYGGFMCKVIYLLQTQILFASVYTLFALSLTRYHSHNRVLLWLLIMATLEIVFGRKILLDAKGLFGGNVSRNRARYKKG